MKKWLKISLILLITGCQTVPNSIRPINSHFNSSFELGSQFIIYPIEVRGPSLTQKTGNYFAERLVESILLSTKFSAKRDHQLNTLSETDSIYHIYTVTGSLVNKAKQTYSLSDSQFDLIASVLFTEKKSNTPIGIIRVEYHGENLEDALVFIANRLSDGIHWNKKSTPTISEEPDSLSSSL